MNQEDMTFEKAVPVAGEPRTFGRVFRRGLSNAWGNRRVVLVEWLVTVLTGGFALLALGVLLSGMGIDFKSLFAGNPEQLGFQIAEAVEGFGGLGSFSFPAFGISCGMILLVLLVTFFHRAGVGGILYSGDRQAPETMDSEPAVFKTFSGRAYWGWGWRYLGRFSTLFLILIGLNLVVCFLIWLLVLASTGAYERWGGAAAAGVGCGGAIPLLFLLLVMILGYTLAESDLPRSESSPLKALAVGLRVLGRRWGAALVLLFLMMALALAAGFVLAPASFANGILFREKVSLYIAGTVVIQVLQWFVSAFFTVLHRGWLVALVRGETGGGDLA